jgi:hypothetical protein
MKGFIGILETTCERSAYWGVAYTPPTFAEKIAEA